MIAAALTWYAPCGVFTAVDLRFALWMTVALAAGLVESARMNAATADVQVTKTGT
jgi:hypothetical protein